MTYLFTDYGQEEAASLYGADPRLFLVTAKSFELDPRKALAGVTIVDVEWVGDDKGRMQSRNLPGTSRTIPAQLVLIAMGFLGPEQAILKELSLETDARSNLKAAHETFTTNHPRIFAAGDCRRGQSLVVWAIHEGRGAARECDRYLMGSTDLP